MRFGSARTGGVAVLIAEQLGVRSAATKALAMAQAVVAMRSEAITMKCLGLCAEMDMRAVPLKGPLLAKRLYGDIATRPTSDPPSGDQNDVDLRREAERRAVMRRPRCVAWRRRTRAPRRP